MTIDLHVDSHDEDWIAHVRVQDGGVSTAHDVTVSRLELARYGATNAEDLVRRSFEFLLQREPATSILRRFSISDISRYFPDFDDDIKQRR